MQNQFLRKSGIESSGNQELRLQLSRTLQPIMWKVDGSFIKDESSCHSSATWWVSTSLQKEQSDILSLQMTSTTYKIYCAPGFVGGGVT